MPACNGNDHIHYMKLTPSWLIVAKNERTRGLRILASYDAKIRPP